MQNPRHVTILVLISIFCVIGHIFSPPDWPFVHEFLFKFTYLPIVLSAIWFGRWFSIQLTTLFCLVYIFHIFLQLYSHAHHHLFSVLLDLGLYFVIAWVTGCLSDTEKDKSNQLSQAYTALKEKTAMLLEFEENARKTERLKTMGELAGVVAHEVRTPLSALQGAVEIVVSENSNDATRKKFSKIIYGEVQRINRVVSDFLKYGSEKNITEESVLLNHFIQENTLLMTSVFKKKNIELTVDIPDDLSVSVQIDPFNQVMMNLLMNAANAISSERGEICILATLVEKNISIVIRDNGEGIPEEISSNLFGAFVTGRKDGSGLGLYLSRNIIKSFGGDIVLNKSEPGCTEFTISLPMKPS